jgi:tetratricopeptide (TPR) repeat protein
MQLDGKETSSLLLNRFSPMTSPKGISRFGWRKPLAAVGCLLLLLLVFGILRVPQPFLATVLSFFLVLVFPGLLLSGLIFKQRLPWPLRLALALSLSVGLWLVPAALALWFHGNLAVVVGVMLGVTLLLAAITLLRAQPSPPSQNSVSLVSDATTGSNQLNLSLRWTRLVYWVALAVSLVLVLVVSTRTTAPYFTDRTAEQAFLRHFLDSDRFLTEGFRISPILVEVTVRDFTHGWGVLLAMVIRLAQVEMLDAYVYYLPLVLIAFSSLSFYALATELFQNQIAVLSACLVQILYVFSDIAVHEGIGRSLFMRIMQDKLTMNFILLPVAIWLAFRYVKRGEWASLISLSIVLVGLALIHPLGAPLYSIFFGLLLLVRVLFGSWSQKRRRLIRALPIIILVLVMLVIPLAERLVMTTYDSADRFLGDMEDNMDDQRASRLIRLGGCLDLYIAQPDLIDHPLVILAILLTPLLLPYVRTHLSAQYLLSNMAGVLFLCYTPFLASVLGMLVTPWLIWRVLWLLPVSLVIGFFLGEASRLPADRFRQISPQLLQLLPLVLILIGALLLRGRIDDGLDYLLEKRERSALTAEQRALFAYLREHATPGSVIMTPQKRLDNEIPGLVGHSYGLTFRNAPPLEESMYEDRYRFYQAKLVIDDHIRFLQKHNIDYIILEADTELAGQVKGLPAAFMHLYSNESLELYQVSSDLAPNPTIAGNTHLLSGEVDRAIASYREALVLDPEDAVAHFGLAEVYRTQGDGEQALSEYRKAVLANPEVLAPKMIDNLSQFFHIDPVYLLPFLVRGDYYRSRPDADLANSDWASYSFLEHLDSAHVPSDRRDLVRQTAFVIEGQPRGVLFQHPPAQVAFQVNIPSAARLQFSPSLSPEVWQLGRGDGVQFDIYIEEEQKKWHPLSEYIDPKNIADQRKWQDREIDLSQWAGQTVTIVYETGPGPNDDYRYDWFGWGEPRIVQAVAYDFLAELPAADLDGTDEEVVRRDSLTIDYESRTILYQHPSSRVSYQVNMPQDASLHFGLGMDPAVWSLDRGDGVEYSVYVRKPNEPTILRSVFSRHIDPKHEPEDRHWLDQVVDLRAYAGETVDIVFEALSGPNGDADSDWGGWSTPVLVGIPRR